MMKKEFDPQVIEKVLKPKLKKFLKKVYKEKSNLSKDEKSLITDMVIEEMIVKAVENYKEENPDLEEGEIKDLKKKLRKLIGELKDTIEISM
jgi:translation initiation factor 2 beta subunit (eIF-2beta)/eIF-5